MDFLINEDCHTILNTEEIYVLRERLRRLILMQGKEELVIIACSLETAMLLYLFRKELEIENEIEMIDGDYYMFDNLIEIDDYICFGKVVTGYELL